MGYPKINTSLQQKRFNLTPCANRRTGHGVKHIVVHYTGTNASARNNCLYFGRANRDASADYFIDKNGTIYKFNADCAKYYSWHCGDGNGRYGITNAHSIGIEVVSAGQQYTQKQKDSLRALTLAIMADYGVSASRIVRHYDASRKHCPAPYCASNAKDRLWNTLKAYITKGTSTSKPATKPAAKQATGTKYTVVANGLNYRNKPSTVFGRVKGTLKKGSAVYLKNVKKNDSGNTWGQIASGTGKGNYVAVIFKGETYAKKA